MHRSPHILSLLAIAGALSLGTQAAFAQATIDHNKALAGSVTPGDAPGYPVTLSKSGHYVLKGNLVVPAGSAGIDITASNVTVDLNGFSVTSGGSCVYTASPVKKVTCAGSAIAANSGVTNMGHPASNLVVRNGFVKGFAGNGVMLLAPGSVIENVVASDNTQTGLEVSDGGRIVGSTSYRNGYAGVYGYNCVIERSVLKQNGVAGGEVSLCLVSETMVSENPQGVPGGEVRGVRFHGNTSDTYHRSLGGNLSSANVVF